MKERISTRDEKTNGIRRRILDDRLAADARDRVWASVHVSALRLEASAICRNSLLSCDRKNGCQRREGWFEENGRRTSSYFRQSLTPCFSPIGFHPL